MQDLSFEQNEARVFNLASKGTNARTKVLKRSNVEDERPTKDHADFPKGKSTNSETGSNLITRQKINIDENEDTFHN